MTRVAVLFVLVVITLGSAYYLLVERHPEASSQPHLLFGGLADESGSLNQVIIENSTGTLFKARKEGELWVATHLDTVMTFPVDIEKLSEFVSALTQTRIIEPKTAKASQYPVLGVEPVTQPGALSTLITLSSDSKKWRVLIGNLASSGMGRYVREPSQRQSYLVDENIPLPLTSNDWLLPDVISVGLDGLQSVDIDDKPPFSLRKGEDGNWQLSENKLPLAYPGVLVHTLNDIINFEYDSVVPLVEQPAKTNLTRVIKLVAIDGKLLEMSVYREPQQTDGYMLTLKGDLIPDNLSEWEYQLTDFQARGLLSAKKELLQQPDGP